ncbi:MAG TPA: hypothetical protein VIV60_21865 [Polyangiaceae bacterium]
MMQLRDAQPFEAMDELDRLRQVLCKQPSDECALRALEAALVLGANGSALEAWSEEYKRDSSAEVWLRELIAEAMRNERLSSLGHAAESYALLRWGAADSGLLRDARVEARTDWPTSPYLTAAKLRHDIEQLAYLAEAGVLERDFVQMVTGHYQTTLERFVARGGERQALDETDRECIGRYYNRILHLRPTPRVAHALSRSWDRVRVVRDYLDPQLGVAVIDDFLTRDALIELRAFCLESTIWFANRYGHGRLGAFLHDGFACPLLMQIAEELRRELPEIYLPIYPLTQVWAFKNTEYLPRDATTHADFAAVSSNLWITPDSANLAPEAGGLTIHNVAAPLHWDFATYNGRGDVIGSFLRQQGASTLSIPHRQNRAIIFNADLFHGTEEVRFLPGY